MVTIKINDLGNIYMVIDDNSQNISVKLFLKVPPKTLELKQSFSFSNLSQRQLCSHSKQKMSNCRENQCPIKVRTVSAASFSGDDCLFMLLLFYCYDYHYYYQHHFPFLTTRLPRLVILCNLHELCDWWLIAGNSRNASVNITQETFLLKFCKISIWWKKKYYLSNHGI